jgi:hypothetical protein
MSLNNKVEIYSIHYNKPEYIKLQVDSFKKFIDIDFEFYVIDNSVDVNLRKKIESECDDNNVHYLLTDNKTPHHPMYYGWSHIFGMDFFKERLLNSESKYVFLIEHDIFFSSPYSNISTLVENNAICGVSQFREHITYLHPGILLFNKEIATELDTLDLRGDVREEDGRVNIDLDGVLVDTGGQTYKYIKKNEGKIFFIDEYVNAYLEEPKEKHVFYHMVKGSNWNRDEDVKNKLKLEKIKKIIYE